MSFLSFLQTTEADVVAVISDVAAGVTLLESQISAALKWIAGEVPTIVTDLQTAVGLAQQVGIVTPAELTAANAAVAALNAFATSTNAGNGTAESVVSGYVAYKQAVASVATATASAAAAATQTPAAQIAAAAPAAKA